LKPPSDQRSVIPALEKVEKVRLIAYRLWLSRRDSNTPGNADSDYYQAEQILESYKNLKFLLLGSFGYSAVAYVLGRSPEEHYTNAMNAVIGLNELADESELSPELREILLQSDGLRLLADIVPRKSPRLL
jgi:hypothetical protein